MKHHWAAISFFIVAASSSPAFADNCDEAVNAMIKQTNTPYRTITKFVDSNNQHYSYEGVTINNTTYVNIDHKWKKFSFDPQTEKSKITNQINQLHKNCVNKGVDKTSGYELHVYNYTSDYGGTINSTLWIDPKNCLPIFEELDVPGSTKSSIKFEYNNVRQPEGIK